MAWIASLTRISEGELDRLIKRIAAILLVGTLAFVAFYVLDRFRMPAPSMVDQTIASLDLARVRGAPARGRRLKMVAAARRDGGRILGRVEAREVPLDHPFALVDGTSSILRITTDLVGSISVFEEAPDLRTTAYGVLSDLMSLAD